MSKKTDIKHPSGAVPAAPKATAKPVKTDNSKNGYLQARRAARRKASK